MSVMVYRLIMSRPPYEEIEHTADKALRAYGETLPKLFEHAALGMFDLMVHLETVKPERLWELELSATSGEDLLHQWLEELVYLFESEAVMLCQFEITEFMEWRLKATVRGSAMDQHTRRRGAVIKAVTYHDLAIEPDNGGWQATLTFDV